MVCGTCKYSIHGVYAPTDNWGAPHCSTLASYPPHCLGCLAVVLFDDGILAIGAGIKTRENPMMDQNMEVS